MMQRTGVEEAIRQAANPVVLMQRLADEAMTIVEGAEGALVQLAHDEEDFTIECASGYLEERIGGKVPLAGSLTGLAFERGETLRCDDTDSDPRVERELCRVFGVVSVVCVPLWRGDKPVGVFSVNSSRPRAFDDRDVATLTGVADFMSVAIAAAVDLARVTDALLTRTWRDTPGAAVAHPGDWTAEQRFIANVLNPGAMGKLETRNRVDRFLRGRGLSHVFQPVYDLTSGETFAVEALARFSGQPRRSPDLWFAEAREMGVGNELEVVSVRGALASLPRLPRDVALCVNAGPEAIISEEVHALLAGSEPGRVVMELSEQAKVDDYPRLSCASGKPPSEGRAPGHRRHRCRLCESCPYPQARARHHQAGPRAHLGYRR